MKVIPGALVDFFSDGEIVAGVVLSEEKGRLRVVTDAGREDRIAPGRILAAYEGSSRLSSAAAKGAEAPRLEVARELASRHARTAREKQGAIDVPLVWDLIVDEGGEKRLEELSDLAIGERGAVAVAAMLRALLEEKVHFARRGDLWEPRPRSAVEETLRQREREARRAEERSRFLDAVRRTISEGAPFARSGSEEEERLLHLLEEVAVHGSAGPATRDALSLLSELPVGGETPDESAFRVLRALGVFGDDENLLIRRFGLHVEFPPGAEELAEHAVREALDAASGAETRTGTPTGPAAGVRPGAAQSHAAETGLATGPESGTGHGAASDAGDRPEADAAPARGAASGPSAAATPSSGSRWSGAQEGPAGIALPPRLAEEVLRGTRRDLTALEAFSVDDELTSEIDDALSVESAGEGRWRVGVHIADPGFFIAPGSELDRIAETRAVTFYLPDRRVLMLPGVLSEDAAALLAGVLRPALSFFATLDGNARLLDRQIVPSVIRSRARVTYEEADAVVASKPLTSPGTPSNPESSAARRAQAVGTGSGGRSRSESAEFGGAAGPRAGDGGGGTAPLPPAFAAEQCRVLHGLALSIEQARIDAGAHVIRAPEVDLTVSADGTIALKRLEGDSPGRLLVSEMMILAGRIAAEFCHERAIPCIYRRQPPPEESSPPVRGGPYDPVAVRKARRGLRRGETGLMPGRHYALGLDAYAQATSPIRRYQDLAIHRQIKGFLLTAKPRYDTEALQRIAATTDEAERVARLAERASDEYWTLRYLERQIGKEVEGVVVQREARRVEVELTETLYSVSIPPRPDHELGARLRLVVESVNPRGPSIRLRQLD